MTNFNIRKMKNLQNVPRFHKTSLKTFKNLFSTLLLTKFSLAIKISSSAHSNVKRKSLEETILAIRSNNLQTWS